MADTDLTVIEVSAHNKYPDWCTLTQVDTYFATAYSIHVHKGSLQALITKLQEMNDEQH